MSITLSALQRQRRDTAANWTAEDPTLLAGEIGLESDTGYWKVGDGATAWTSLAYVSGLGAEIPVERLADGAARQLLQTDAAGTGVEWTDNVDVPGTLDVTGAGTFDGNVTIAGDLTVNGTTTTINTQDLLVEDKNVIIGNVTSPTDVTADGGGITLKGTTDKTINWVDATDAWTLSEHVNIASGKEYRIDGTKVLDATSLGSAVVSSSLTSVGTIGTGVWQGTAIDAAYLDSTVVTTGDTGTVTSTMIADGTIVDGDVNASAAIAYSKLALTGTIVDADVSASAEIAVSKLADGAARQLLQTDAAGTGVEWTDNIDIPGTLDVVGVATFDSSATIVGDLTVDTNTLYVDSTNNRVGVGTTSPQQLLHVNSSAASGGQIQVTNASTGTASTDGVLIGYDGSNDVIINNQEATALKLFTSGSERARIDSSGRLLVGTSSARSVGGFTSPLEIEGINASTSSISLTRNNNGAGWPFFTFAKTRGTGAGGVGLVVAADRLGEILFAGGDGLTANSVGGLIACDVDGTPGANDMPGRLVFSVTADGSASPTEAMRINNAGELLVGYTSDNGAYKLQVNSQIFATSATIATSDGRYKQNVATLDGCVDLVKALRPVSFDWKHQEPITRIDEKGETVVVREAHNFPDGTQVGFIAQEVETVLADKPWLGSVIKQNVRPAVTDADGNELAPEEEFLGIAEGNLVAVLTSALKDVIGEIESLKARVAALEAS